LHWAPGGAIQAKFLRLIVVTALHGKGGDGPQRQELVDIDTGPLQQHKQPGDVVAVGRLDTELPQPGLEGFLEGLLQSPSPARLLQLGIKEPACHAQVAAGNPQQPLGFS
jgi:hypothetical protein